MSGVFSDLVKQSIDRTREATLSVLGITDEGLRKHLSDQMHHEFGRDGSFLAAPVFEHTYGWEPGEQTLASLRGNLLSEEIVDALTKSEDPNYKFSEDIRPYKHQLCSWRTLLEVSPQSVVITTGTGSGKTECFMVPILQDLLNESQKTSSPLVGVRALFLYPLNALINSQRERLHAWTKPFGKNIRFCLYNGNTPEKMIGTGARRKQAELPNQVLSRDLLRKEPAPILMTNATMLEYMLVRQVDSPILEKSRESGSLRWIVLDEAHTYIGSQAAELSLLLRRVVEAFGKRAEEIRFVATSATIAGPEAQSRLRTYLADLAGVSESQVVVIGGRRRVPVLNDHGGSSERSLDDIRAIDSGLTVSEQRFTALANSKTSRALRDKVVQSDKPQTVDDLVQSVTQFLSSKKTSQQQDEVIQWLDLMSSTKADENAEPFIKLRMHLFQRMLHGLWGCVDPSCKCKSETLQDWPYGNVYLTQRSQCECGAPVYEVAFCDECKQPHLIAEDINGLLQQASQYSGDEFSLLEDVEDDESSAEINQNAAHQQKVIIGSTDSSEYVDISLDLSTRELGLTDSNSLITVKLSDEASATCSACDYTSNRAPGAFLRKAYLGAPFFVSQAVPTVLEFCPKPAPKDIGGNSPDSMPAGARKLITFTDSRQGTARMAVRMQQEAERSKLRGLVFQVLRNQQVAKNMEPRDIPTSSPEELIKQAEHLESIGMRAPAQLLRDAAENLISGNSERAEPVVVAWAEMVDELAKFKDFQYSILDYNKYANPQFFGGDAGSKKLARLLLMREYSRRPKNQNSSETLALVKVSYKGLESISNTPQHWIETQVPKLDNQGENEALTLNDWKDFLKVALDFYVRENTFISIGRDEQNWMGARFAPKLLFPADYQYSDTRSKAWPTIQRVGNYSRLIKVLAIGARLDLDNPSHRDIINVWLRAAWTALINAQILQSHDNGYALSHNALEFSLPIDAWVCPVTNRLIDTTFRGFTPYLPRILQPETLHCRRVKLPYFYDLAPDGESTDLVKEIRSKVAENADVKSLRSQGLWTDISDRTAEGGFYYRTAEHSAQQSAERLQNYEEQFKQGRINVLNCSTTMEMGVDIGGVSAVVMNNVPPHPANYLQRAGRAGRRSEARAVAYTLCKPDPHNTRVFHNPKWPFETAIPAPAITLTAEPLVMRHVNSFLLANFLCNEIQTEDDDRTKLNVQWFFAGDDSPSQKFIDWLSDVSQLPSQGLKKIIKGTALEAKSLATLADEAKLKISNLAKDWRDDYARINQRVEQASEPAYKKAMELERKRHEEEYLLRDLAARAFLPGYGFPTDVVSLSTYNVEDFLDKQTRKEHSSRDDNIFQYKEKPSRDMSVAIREYAPGAQVVIDGRVYKSAGILLHAFQTGDSGIQKFDIAWRCSRCGTQGYKEYAYLNEQELTCYECHSLIPYTEIKRILRPAGFVTDFYESTSNDVSSQKFIPVNTPRVSVEGNTTSLPDARCGFIRFGHNGHVFYHSSGENQHGFAICMECGKAESMTTNNEIPAPLQSNREHRPITGGKGISACSGDKVMSNIHLGYQTTTNVIELALKNPTTGEWLPINDRGKVIANTLAVAMRDTIAARLAISSTEMGFGIRQDKDLESGSNRVLIQVYDNVAGGAGFALSALEDLTGLLFETFGRLECVANCQNVCSSCLAGQDSRVEDYQLDRHVALDWIRNSAVKDYLNLPAPFDQLEGAQYWAYEPRHFIRHWINLGAKAIALPLSIDTESWELTEPAFRNALVAWKLVDGINIKLLIRKTAELTTEIKDALATYEKIGVLIEETDHAPEHLGVQIAAQVVTQSDQTISLLASNDQVLQPGKQWLQSSESSLWVFTSRFKELETTSIDTSDWHHAPVGAEVIEVKSELNVPLNQLGKTFRNLISEKAFGFADQLNHDKVVSIHYQDRYFKSPWNVMILMALLEAFRNDQIKQQLSIETVADSSPRDAHLIWHNWPDETDMKEMMTQWIQLRYNSQPEVIVHERVSDLSHRRVMTIEFESGSTWKLAFDQGMGYWESSSFNRENNIFDFSLTVEDQLRRVLNIWPNLKLRNVGDWPTDISIYQ